MWTSSADFVVICSSLYEEDYLDTCGNSSIQHVLWKLQKAFLNICSAVFIICPTGTSGRLLELVKYRCEWIMNLILLLNLYKHKGACFLKVNWPDEVNKINCWLHILCLTIVLTCWKTAAAAYLFVRFYFWVDAVSLESTGKCSSSVFFFYVYYIRCT